MRGDARARWIVAPVVAVLLLALGAGASDAGAALLSSCSTRAKDRTLCGRVTVPLDRSGSIPGSIALRVRALPPSRGVVATGTVLALAGGPGQAATPLLDGFASVLAPALRSRQLVVFDQRGTGGSGRLACGALAREGDAVSAVGQCASELGPARAHYATADSVADIEAVRVALGVDRLILYGTSYGTKVALDYAAVYPEHVERLVLDSVVPPEGVDPFERTTIASIPRILRTLCAHACGFTRDPVADLAALVRRLARGPLRGTTIDGAGRPRAASLTRAGLLELLVSGDFDRHARAALPAAVRAALDGDAAPLLRLAAGSSDGGVGTNDDSDAVFVATTCEDGGVPWSSGTPLDQRRQAANAAAAAIPAAAFAPFDRTTARAVGTVDLCRRWPESPIVQPSPGLPSTSTLILSGDDDLRTPRSDATALAARLADAQVLPVLDAGHGVLFSDPTDCAQVAVVAFLDGKTPGNCRPHRRAVATLGLAPQSLDGVRGVSGLRPRAGRTMRATILTLDDATEQVLATLTPGGASRSFGGLREGSATVGRTGLRLRGYGFVPGVIVTGSIPATTTRFTLRVGGRTAAHGRLTFSRTGIAGVLDGQSVHASAATLGWRSATAAAAERPSFPARPALRLPAAGPLARPRLRPA